MVKNILVSINIAADQLPSDINRMRRGFVFLSDENGKVISATEYKNNDKLVLRNPNFQGEYFFLTEVTTEKSASYLGTFAQIERGKNWVLLNLSQDTEEVYLGTATVNFLNAKPGVYSATSNGSTGYGIGQDRTTETFDLHKSPSKLFVTLYSPDEKTPSKYSLYSGITVGENTVDLAKVTMDFAFQDVTFPDRINTVNVYIYGISVANNFDEYYSLASYYYSQDPSQSRRLYYPGTAFPMYYSFYHAQSNDIYYEKGSTHDLFKLDQIKNNLSFSFKENKLTYSASGDFDFFTILVGPEETTWQFILPEGDGVLPTFDIPEILEGQPIPALSVPVTDEVLDIESLNNYEDLKSFIRKSNRSLFELSEFGANYTSIIHNTPANGGRLRTHGRSRSLIKRHP
jgi:hypothetical protein